MNRKHRPSKPLCETLEEFTDSGGEGDSEVDNQEDVPSVGGERAKAHFYVYCPTCKAMKAGKLRVRCSTCRYVI